MKKTRYFFIFTPLIIGIIIYVLYRSRELYYYNLIHIFEMSDSVDIIRSSARDYRSIIPNWFIYSLPDGLWLFSAGACFLLFRKCYFLNFIFFTLVFNAALLVEFLQKFYGGHGSKLGTYDIHDIYSYLFAYVSIILFSLFCEIFNKKRDFFAKEKKDIFLNIKYTLIYSVLAFLPSLL